MQLTQEYFDKGIGAILEKMAEMITKTDLVGMATKADLTLLATKADLEKQTKELKNYTTEAFETQQDWMEERFQELVVMYDVRHRVERLEKDVMELKFGRANT